jgi:anti-sigma B factor antagonist
MGRPQKGLKLIFYVKDDEGVDQDGRVVSVGGELDLRVAPAFREAVERVIDKGARRLLVDLSEVTFIDSTSIGVLVGALKRLRASGGSLELICTEKNVLRTLEVSGLDQEFRIHSSRDEALAGAVVAQ